MTSKEKIRIWGRNFELEVRYDCYTGEEILESQKKALSAFLGSEDAVDASLEEVKKYCLEQNGNDIGESVIENIFKYVMPKYIYVLRNTEKPAVAVMCNYKFDPEHGIAIVFEDGKIHQIGKQDMIL